MNGPLRRRVLVRTFPPASNPNYGGILQAWALQRSLEKLGLEAFVDSTRPERWVSRRALMAQRTKTAILRNIPVRALPAHVGQWATRASVNRAILRFPRIHIRQAALFASPDQVRGKVLASFDAFVAGSDQVWRPDYVDVGKYLFDFLPDSFGGPRVSYAASFGSDSPVFSDALRTRTALLASRLTAASVREDSGVALTRELWGIDAALHVDPTLLLDQTDYEPLVRARHRHSVPVKYILDADEAKMAAARDIEGRLGASFRDLYPALPASFAAYRRAPKSFDRLSVEEWLAAVASASFVLTDSFHGTVLSILFERPFVTVPNQKRGTARFASLLGMFGLSNRLAKTPEDAARLTGESIDWTPVRSRLADERRSGMAFLRSALTEA